MPISFLLFSWLRLLRGQLGYKSICSDGNRSWVSHASPTSEWSKAQWKRAYKLPIDEALEQIKLFLNTDEKDLEYRWNSFATDYTTDEVLKVEVLPAPWQQGPSTAGRCSWGRQRRWLRPLRHTGTRTALARHGPCRWPRGTAASLGKHNYTPLVSRGATSKAALWESLQRCQTRK